MANYSRLNPTVEAASEEWPHGAPTMVSQDTEYVSPSNAYDTKPDFSSNLNSLGSDHGSNTPNQKPVRPGYKFWGSQQRSSSGFSIASAPWEHQIREKHLRNGPSTSDTTRYFDRRRQTRRVFIDGFIMWLCTLIICVGLAGTIYGFSTIQTGLSQLQKYAYNALVTGLSIVLGLAFAAQFKQYAEMMRWRFLTSQYRSLREFEDVLGCDSYRSTVRIMFKHGRQGSWVPSKVQLIAAFWILVFITFNVFAALIGLTYSIDVSTTYVHIEHGNVSVVDLSYIAASTDTTEDYTILRYQMPAANVYGTIGQRFQDYNSTLDTIESYTGGDIFHDEAQDLFWYRFVDLSPDDATTSVVSTRTVTSTAVCQEYKVIYGGYAGMNTDNATLIDLVEWEDEYGRVYAEEVTPAATGFTTWMGNTTSACGPRCAQILALQSADNSTALSIKGDTPYPRMWACNNTVGQVANYNDGFDNPDDLKLADEQAFILAGAIGWTGVNTTYTALQFVKYNGLTQYNPTGTATAHDMAALIMRFTVGTLAAMDTLSGPRFLTLGDRSPSPAQIVNVQWWDCGAILVGIPAVQFLMLLGVVWFSGKSIILEPSFLTTAHLLRPVLDKVGDVGGGCLLSANELAERLGPNFKIAYGVRPNCEDPGYHDDTFVRHLDVIEESAGFGKLTRGKMPQGRYD